MIAACEAVFHHQFAEGGLTCGMDRFVEFARDAASPVWPACLSLEAPKFQLLVLSRLASRPCKQSTVPDFIVGPATSQWSRNAASAVVALDAAIVATSRGMNISRTRFGSSLQAREIPPINEGADVHQRMYRRPRCDVHTMRCSTAMAFQSLTAGIRWPVRGMDCC
jgi:hypothetical protein